MRKIYVFIVVVAGLVCTISASEKIVISQWLISPGHEISLPVFYDQPNTKGKTYTPEDLLGFDHVNLNGHFPESGVQLTGLPSKDIRWSEAFSDSNGYVSLNGNDHSEHPQVAYIAAYIWAEKWMKTSLEIKSPHMLKAWVNGEVIGTKNTTEQEENTIGKVSKDLKLERGKHLLVIKTVKPKDAPLDWKVMANLEIKDPWTLSDMSISLSPVNRKNIKHIMDGVKTSGIQLSADGKYYLITQRRSLPPSDQSESWSEVRRVSDEKLIHTFRHARVTQAQWLPTSNKISYINTRDKKSTLFLHDLENGEISVLMEDMEDLTSYRWAPNEQFIIYSVKEEGSSTDTDMRQVLGMQDRQANFRHRNFLHHIDLTTKLHRRLTSGNITSSLHDISPDSKSIVFSHNFADYASSPSFSRQSMFLMKLSDLTIDTLWSDAERSVRVRFSPDGNFLLATGGPSAFDRVGENIPEGMIANNYDTQAYIYDLQSSTVNAFTRDFNPSISSVYWHKADNSIYLLTTDEDYQKLYRYDPKRERMSLIDLGFDHVSSVNFAADAPAAVFQGSQTTDFPRHYMVNLRNLRLNIINENEAENYRHVEFGDTENWSFTASSGVEIKGRVYFPPDFNPDSKYPVIVYYYGGTTPVGRTFAGRYPFNLWAGSGYVVYVLQPSGATGFGQEFSAAHVNNWGYTVADEIIEGTKKFLEAHPFADRGKVGCAGASYGGFMTMLLMTRTDIFAAAISHAGISSISSYWGEGYSGYGYSSEASAGSFPWNNKDLYVGQSPLFHADKVTTPLLLLSGDSDTNVPPGESIQMYTALKILDRPVELILVKGEDHHIITYGKRIKWHNAIMAWWDKYLKDQPQWWEDQFPEKNY